MKMVKATSYLHRHLLELLQALLSRMTLQPHLSYLFVQNSARVHESLS